MQTVDDLPKILLGHIGVRRFNAGDYLIRGGDKANCIIIVRSGSAKISCAITAEVSGEPIVATAGWCIGMVAALHNGEHDSDVVALESSTASLVSADLQGALIELAPSLYDAYCLFYGSSLRQLNRWLPDAFGPLDLKSLFDPPPLWAHAALPVPKLNSGEVKRSTVVTSLTARMKKPK